MKTRQYNTPISIVYRKVMAAIFALIEDGWSLISTSSLHGVIFELMMIAFGTFLFDCHFSLSALLFWLIFFRFFLFVALLYLFILIKTVSELLFVPILFKPLFSFSNRQSSFDWFAYELWERELIFTNKAGDFRSECI